MAGTGDAEERLETLRRVPIFKDLAPPMLDRVAGVATEVDLPAGHVLIERGQPGTGLFVLLEGTVELRAGSEPLTRGPGDFVGELALLAPGTPRTARVRAATPVKCLAIRRDDFYELMLAEPSIAVAMLQAVAQRLAESGRASP